ncbi:MAG TPA: MFS transporter [Dongiaceae bacterium]|nr:MFS transporter [Dongiaceae bacterium]
MQRRSSAPPPSSPSPHSSAGHTPRKPANDVLGGSWLDIFRHGFGIYTLTINLAMAMHAIDVFITAAVMPKVVKDIGGISFYTWPTTLYMVASIIGAASNAPLRAIFGTRRAYMLASFTFLLGSIGCALAPTMLVMLLARSLQGWGGGLLISLSMALVQSVYPEQLRKRALAFISSTWGVAALLGPAVGGLFAEHGFWRGAFWFNVPIVAVFMIGAWIKLPRHSVDPGSTKSRFPYRRLGMLTLGVCAVSLAGEAYEAMTLLGLDPTIPVYRNIAILMQVVLIAIAVLAVHRTIHLDRPDRVETGSRLLPTRPLGLATSTGIGGWVMLLSSMTHSVIGAYLPLALQAVRGTSDSVAAYIMACLAVAWTLASVGTSHFQGKAAQACITIGLLLSTIGLAILAVSMQSGSLLVIALADALVGIGLGTTNLHLVAAVMRHATRGEEGLTAGAIPTIRSLGISFGAAGAGVIANSAGLGQEADPATINTAIHWVLGLGCVLPLAAAVFAVLFVRLTNRQAARTATPQARAIARESDAELAEEIGPEATP